MYVCLCNGHREADIRALAQAGLDCVHEIYRTLGGEANCGGCLEVARTIIEESCGECRLSSPASGDTSMETTA